MYKKEERNSIFLLATLYCVAFVGQMYPYGFPLFLLVTICTLTFQSPFLIKYKAPIDIYSLSFYYVVLLFLISLAASLDKFNDYIQKDLSNLVTLFVIYIISINILNTQKKINIFIEYLKMLVFISSLIVAAIGLFKFKALLAGNKIDKFYIGDIYPWGTSLVGDYNYFSLSLICGLIIAFSFFTKSQNSLIKFLVTFVMIMLSLTIILSGSRRGLLIIAFLLFILIMMIAFKVLASLRVLVSRRVKQSNFIFVAYCLLALCILIYKVDFIQLLQFNDFSHLDNLVVRAESLMSLGDGQSEAASQRLKRVSQTFDYLGSSTPMQLIFGSGFSYLEYFGKANDTPSGFDYPHNLFLSIMLSNGLIGVVILCGYIGGVLYSFHKNRKKLLPFYIFYLVATLFSLSSGNQLFSIKVYVLVGFIPVIYQIRRVQSEKCSIYSTK